MIETSESATSYDDAVSELDDILTELESGTVNIDTLTERVTRGAELIRWCRQRLDAVRTDVDSIVDQLHDS